ncbi:hypothetical protein SOVF_083990 [Spinacia oleracea]|uniref:Uncharacterized protein LOC110789839 n=1 Tax=Spinacia oleracea TaxID=3562 RepID=A0A9R0JXL6_SPIOL|nr:uncharacterized protein LOC110789839 [Spinacia oleracea]XP_056686137.1 uncharacterized protein LOC110789839 [Spinacia oleracea]XP_056686138.1 uncharacterized protein LOC110789839 [Spinacia oleracea]KNA17001.1 hypothetical protein SOVF_083990 [Spinacia oleracea]
MKKRGRAAMKKTSAADFLTSPPEEKTVKTRQKSTESSPTKSFEFTLMKERGKAATKKTSAADFLNSPPEAKTVNTRKKSTESSPTKSFEFTLNSPSSNAANRRKSPMKSSPLRKTEVSSSITELKDAVSSHLDSIKRQVERSHSDILKEAESSNSRLHKRLKIQAQACQNLMDETDKEFKKMSERVAESCEAMKASYSEFMVDAQTSAARVCKTSIPEKAPSFEKAMDSLRKRYGIFSPA